VEEEFLGLGGDVDGNMESLLVILLGLVEEVSNINDLELVIKVFGKFMSEYVASSKSVLEMMQIFFPKC